MDNHVLTFEATTMLMEEGAAQPVGRLLHSSLRRRVFDWLDRVGHRDLYAGQSARRRSARSLLPAMGSAAGAARGGSGKGRGDVSKTFHQRPFRVGAAFSNSPTRLGPRNIRDWARSRSVGRFIRYLLWRHLGKVLVPRVPRSVGAATSEK